MLVSLVFTSNLEPSTVVVLLLPLSPNPIVVELISVSVFEGIAILGVVSEVVVSILRILPSFPILIVSEVISVVVLSTFNLLPLKVIISSILESSSFEEIFIVLPSSKTEFVSVVDFSSI